MKRKRLTRREIDFLASAMRRELHKKEGTCFYGETRDKQERWVGTPMWFRRLSEEDADLVLERTPICAEKILRRLPYIAPQLEDNSYPHGWRIKPADTRINTSVFIYGEEWNRILLATEDQVDRFKYGEIINTKPLVTISLPERGDYYLVPLEGRNELLEVELLSPFPGANHERRFSQFRVIAGENKIASFSKTEDGDWEHLEFICMLSGHAFWKEAEKILRPYKEVL